MKVVYVIGYDEYSIFDGYWRDTLPEIKEKLKNLQNGYECSKDNRIFKVTIEEVKE